MVRRMGGPGGEIHKEWLVRRERLLGTRPDNRLIGHVSGEVVVGIVGQMNRCRAIVKDRRKLIGLASDEAVEFFEA